MNLADTLIFVIAFFNIALAIVVYIHGSHRWNERFFILLAFSVSAWTLATFFTTSSVPFWIFKTSVYLHYIVGNLIYLFFMWFVYYYPNRSSRTLVFPWTITSISMLMLLLIVSSSFLFESISVDRHINFNNSGYLFFFSFILFTFIVPEILLIKKLFLFREKEKVPLRYIVVGTTIASVPAFFSNLILPFFGNFTLFHIGPLFAIPFMAIISYAIFKHHLFDLKVISTEIFSAALALVLFAQIFFADTLTLRLISIGVFLGAVGFGVLLVRSVIKEVKNREELEHLAQELSLANEELKKLDRAKSEFISIASHQLRTPLSIIKGYISMIQEGSFGHMTKKLAEPLHRVYLSNERLIKLVNDLLDLSRMEGGRMRYEMKLAQFSVIIASVVEEFQQIAQSKGLTFRFKKENKENDDPPVRFDEEKMRQVAFNLIDNAMRYTPKGGSITVTLAINPYHLLFSVVDTGIGLDKQEINSLFQKFVRSKEVMRIHTEGVGLGLYVARRIVEDHGGRIWAESAGKGKGSTFFVELPIKKITV